MKSKQLFFSVAAMAVTASVLFVACSKSTSADAVAPTATQQSVSLYLTDGPGVFNNVYLDIKSVEVLVDTSKNTRDHDRCNWDTLGNKHPLPKDSTFFVWNNLNVTAGVYDLLQLRNGVDTLLSTSNIAKGAIRLIRINLGTANYIIKDSVKYNLNIPPNAPSYIIVKLGGGEWEHFGTNAYRLWLDFDVARSIIFYNNTYYLAPFLRPFLPSQTGAVYGSIAPKDAFPELIKVFSSTDTSMALPNKDGVFLVRGLKDGTYSVLIHSLRQDSLGIAIQPYKDTTISNVVVKNANTVFVGNISLHK